MATLHAGLRGLAAAAEGVHLLAAAGLHALLSASSSNHGQAGLSLNKWLTCSAAGLAAALRAGLRGLAAAAGLALPPRLRWAGCLGVVLRPLRALRASGVSPRPGAVVCVLSGWLRLLLPERVVAGALGAACSASCSSSEQDQPICMREQLNSLMPSYA